MLDREEGVNNLKGLFRSLRVSRVSVVVLGKHEAVFCTLSVVGVECSHALSWRPVPNHLVKLGKFNTK